MDVAIVAIPIMGIAALAIGIGLCFAISYINDKFIKEPEEPRIDTNSNKKDLNR